MGAFDLGWQTVAAKNQQNRVIAEQQRIQQQNTVGMRLLDSINQSSNIKPTMKDDQGNIIPNPAYADAQKDRTQLMSQYSALNAPEQHASFGQHLHGLIFGTPTEHAQQPALSPNSSPVAPMADPNAPTAAAPPPPDPTAPGGGVAHPMAAASPDHPLHAISAGISALGNHLKAFANPLPPPANPVDPALVAKYYRDPTEVAFERNKELWQQRGENALDVWGQRGQTSKEVQELRNLGSTEQARFDNAYAQSLGLADASQMSAQQRLDAQAQYSMSKRRPQTITDPRTGITNIVSMGADGLPVAAPMLDLNGQPFGGFKPNTITIHNGVYHFIGADNQVHEVPVTTETTKIFGPHSGASPSAPTPPVSANAPQLPGAPTSAVQPVNPGARTPGTQPSGGAVKAKPISSAAPQMPAAAGTAAPQATGTPYAPTIAPGGGRVLGPAKLNTQDRGILESDQQVQDSIQSILPTLEALKTKGGLWDKGKMLYEWKRYSNGFPIDDPQLAQVIPAIALIQTQGAAPWTRIGRNKYTFDVIQKHLPAPTDTPALLYTKVKWLSDNVIPSSVDATRNPTPTGRSGPVSAKAPKAPGAKSGPIVITAADMAGH